MSSQKGTAKPLSPESFDKLQKEFTVPVDALGFMDQEEIFGIFPRQQYFFPAICESVSDGNDRERVFGK